MCVCVCVCVCLRGGFVSTPPHVKADVWRMQIRGSRRCQLNLQGAGGGEREREREQRKFRGGRVFCPWAEEISFLISLISLSWWWLATLWNINPPLYNLPSLHTPPYDSLSLLFPLPLLPLRLTQWNNDAALTTDSVSHRGYIRHGEKRKEKEKRDYSLLSTGR